MIEISTFPHHRSLHLNQDLLVPWIQNQLEDSRENINKWESPGFFPHVKLAGRYTIEPVSFTGMVQFDIDNPAYLKNYSSRENLKQMLSEDEACLLVANSFSSHGVWGLLEGDIVSSKDEFSIMSKDLVSSFAHTYNITLDLMVSTQARAFRLICPDQNARGRLCKSFK